MVVGSSFSARSQRITLLLLALLSIGCGAVRNPALESARELYQRARQDSMLVRYASAALDRAGQTIEEADRRWMDDRDVNETEHLAYLATKRIEIARVTAQRRLAEDEVRPSPPARRDSNDSKIK
jgi:OOP family OmpA-OmpF porin